MQTYHILWTVRRTPPPNGGGVRFIVRMQFTWLTGQGRGSGSQEAGAGPHFFASIFFFLFSSKTWVRLVVRCIIYSGKHGNLQCQKVQQCLWAGCGEVAGMANYVHGRTRELSEMMKTFLEVGLRRCAHLSKLTDT